MVETLSVPLHQTNSLRQIFQKRQTLILVVVFILSLAARFNEYYHFREMNSDKTRQLQGAYELLRGNGVSLESYDLKTLKPSLVPLVEWPPGYSFCVAAVSRLTNTNVYRASYILDGMSLTGLWVCLFWLTSLLQFSLTQRCLLLLFLGVSKPPLNLIYSSDLLGTVIFLVACGTVLWHLSKRPGERMPILFFTAESVCLLAMVFLKYSLLPACFAIGASLIIYSFFSWEKLYRTGFFLLGILGICVFTVFLYNNLRSGHLNGLYNRYGALERTVHLANLSMCNPFIVATFYHLDLFYQRFHIPTINAVALALTALLFTAVPVGIFQKVRRREATYFDHLVYTVLFSVVGFLVLLSVYYPKDVHPTHEWTYVKDYRYFSPAVFILLLYLVKNLSWAPRSKSLQSILSVFTTVSIAFALFLSGYYLVTRNEAASYANLNSKYWRIKHVVDSLKNENTYFMALTCRAEDDAIGRSDNTKSASLVATGGTKVVITSEGYFPDSCYSILFSKTALLPAGSRVIVYLDKNASVLDSVNLTNQHSLGQTAFGERYLVINN